jgi:hypothetical protein
MFLFPSPNCPYLLSWVKINGFINKWFYFILFFLKSFPAPAFWSFLFPPCDSIRAFLHTFQHALWWKGKKTENFTCFFLWTAIWEVAILLTYLGICFHPWIIWLCCFFFMLCNLFIYVETIRIILYLVPVSLGLINFRRRIMDLRGKCPCIVLIRSRPCLFHQTHARLLTLASRLLLQ